MADVKFKVLHFLTTTTNGTFVDVTEAGFGVPKAAIFYGTYCSGPNSARVSVFNATGILAGTDQRTVGYNASSSASTTLASLASANDAVLAFPQASGVTQHITSKFSAELITDGVRVTADIAGASGRACSVMLIGGDDVTDAYVNNFNAGTTTSPISVTSPNFNPSALVFITACRSVFGVEANMMHSFGMSVDNGGLKQGSVSIGDQDNLSASSVTNALVSNDAIASRVLADSNLWNTTVQSHDATGFTVQSDATTYSALISYLALKFSPDADVNLVDIQVPTTGDYVESGIGFEPSAGIMVTGSGVTSRNAIATSSNYGIGVSMFDSVGMSAVSGQSQDSVSVSNANSSIFTNLNLLKWDSGYDVESTGWLFTSSGWDFTLTTNPAIPLLGFALAIGPGGAPPVGVQEMYIKDGGIFVKYTPHVKVGGTFQEVDAYVLEGGTWKPVHEK